MLKRLFGGASSNARDAALNFLKTSVKDIMTTYVVTTKPDASVVNAATRMVAQDISCLIVIDEDNHPIGIVTERDYIKKVPSTPSALKLKVKDIMANKVVTTNPDSNVKDAGKLMHDHGFRKLIVSDISGKLVGVVTQTDLVKLALKLFHHYGGDRTFVKDWMSRKLVTVSESTSFADAKKKMIKKDAGAMPVTKAKKYIGIFTEYDVVSQFYDAGGILSIKSPKEIMHPHIKCIASNESIFFANRVMVEKKVRRLLVLDGKKVVGIITQTDIARAIWEEAISMSVKEPKFTGKLDMRTPIVSEYMTPHLKRYALEKF